MNYPLDNSNVSSCCNIHRSSFDAGTTKRTKRSLQWPYNAFNKTTRLELITWYIDTALCIQPVTQISNVSIRHATQDEIEMI